MEFHGFLLLAKLACVICFIVDQTNGAPGSVEWYRTAQNTNDRIAKQPDLTFGGDFTSDQVININRWVASYYVLNNMVRSIPDMV